MGHAVAHLILNEQTLEPETILIEVSLIGDEKNIGYVRAKARRGANPHNCAVRCMAGYAAESLHTKGGDWLRTERQTIIADVARGDYDNLTDVRMAREALGADATSEFAIGNAWDEAIALVGAEWDFLIHLAGMLQQRLTMDGAAIEAEWGRYHENAKAPPGRERAFAVVQCRGVMCRVVS
jgi:hypothetical protein